MQHSLEGRQCKEVVCSGEDIGEILFLRENLKEAEQVLKVYATDVGRSVALSETGYRPSGRLVHLLDYILRHPCKDATHGMYERVLVGIAHGTRIEHQGHELLVPDAAN